MEVMMSMKKFILSLAVFALVGTVNAVLVNNGGFDINAAGWNGNGGGGAFAIAHVTTGGNPGGYISLEAANNTWVAFWQGDAYIWNEDLAEWGIPSGATITLQADIIDLGTAGNNKLAGLKIESWNTINSGTKLEEDAMEFTATGSWAPYSFDYTIPAAAESVKMVLTNVNYNGLGTAKYGWDNVSIAIPGGTPALFPVPIVGGTLPAVTDVISWTNPDPNNPADTITADVFILESDTLITKDPNLGPTILDPGVVMVANDITAESLDLSDAGYTLQVGKYYYWAVHITDPEIGVIEGFDWYFLATGDAPPSEVSAGADQYVWLDGGTNQFTLTGTYTDDGKSPVTIEWLDLSNPLEQAPGTTVTINSPNAAVTTVDVDGDGWFLFSFTVTDGVGSGTDTVNVGVYVDACAAAYADPDDIQTAYPNGTGDIDGDCDTDLNDFALMAATWMDCMSDKLGCNP